MEPVCKYCNEIEDKQVNPGLKCVSCNSLVHLVCLKRQGTPGDFAGDVFFDFTCIDCSDNGEEQFVRNKMPWVNVILLTIHHLNSQSLGISHHGFFHYKTHIASFIDRNWQLLFGSQVKQKKSWMGTIAGTLSVYNGLIFRSGSVKLGEAGWWKLQHMFSPALAAYIITATAKDKKPKQKGQTGLDRTLFYYKIRALGYIDYVVVENDAIVVHEPIAKKPRLNSDNQSESRCSTQTEQSGHAASDFEPRSEPDSMILDESYACLTAKNSYSDVESFFNTYEFDFQSADGDRNDSSSERTTHTDAPHEDSDSRSSHHHAEPCSESEERALRDVRAVPHDVAAKKKAEIPVRQRSLFSSQLNSTDSPWEVKEVKQPKHIVELTEYEEVQLLKQVENLIAKIRDVDKKAYLSRLRAKLALRRLKRHKHLPIFDLDKTVKVLGGYVTEAPKVVADVERVLDRFQRSYLMDSLSGTISQPTYGTILLPHLQATPIRSAYSGAVLKPYIRRDWHSEPLWLRLTDELLRKTNRHIKDYEPPPRASIDYSYVRPQHIPAINSLCAQFFWPGIDLTEALQQPEHSCVVTYGRLVVACAFLVADAARGDAYLSFLLTRPAWRRAGLASFMLYHLLQTCTGKDVTLHVSPTNPAIFLYQKFGFKVEELVQDFYEKYYDINHKGCRHALFLRLVR